jgi:amino acid transporter
LAISGPGGLLIAFGVVGMVAIFVVEGICELIVMWPIPNAMMEFVAAFVDGDLAIVVGIAYWWVVHIRLCGYIGLILHRYTNVVTFAALIIGSGDLLNYFEISSPILNVTFLLFLLLCVGINSRVIKASQLDSGLGHY